MWNSCQEPGINSIGMIANMHEGIRSHSANAVPQCARKQNELVQVSKPLADADAAGAHSPKHWQRTKALDTNSALRKLQRQQIGKSAHTFLAVVCVIPHQKDFHDSLATK
jgi:hypothetical protein